ncbi:Protein of unknown function DUF1043 [gamma proteobacterium HdN1]|nr:Protein of unknown function DUF1043 [gamma proteobacterium HdN1]
MLEVVLFLIGVAVGAGSCFAVMRRGRNGNPIEQQLRDLQEEFTAYRENVNQHFNHTAELVNNLTANYVKVQKHLESASVSFAEPPKSFKLETSTSLAAPAQQFIAIETREPPSRDASFEDEHVQPPLDYAPKKGSRDKGTLAEDFGLGHTQK